MTGSGRGRLERVVALVVGGGQTPGETIGNGRATCVRFAQEGASVVVADRIVERAEDTVAELVVGGHAAVAVGGDVTSSADCEAMVGAATESFGRLDVLVNNVGIGGGGRAREGVIVDSWVRCDGDRAQDRVGVVTGTGGARC